MRPACHTREPPSDAFWDTLIQAILLCPARSSCPWAEIFGGRGERRERGEANRSVSQGKDTQMHVPGLLSRAMEKSLQTRLDASSLTSKPWRSGLASVLGGGGTHPWALAFPGDAGILCSMEVKPAPDSSKVIIIMAGRHPLSNKEKV